MLSLVARRNVFASVVVAVVVVIVIALIVVLVSWRVALANVVFIIVYMHYVIWPLIDWLALRSAHYR